MDLHYKCMEKSAPFNTHHICPNIYMKEIFGKLSLTKRGKQLFSNVLYCHYYGTEFYGILNFGQSNFAMLEFSYIICIMGIYNVKLLQKLTENSALEERRLIYFLAIRI
uniref:Uncharacterized protein n=1 Tax=Cacopsylla melanoneura TaxID=428564 RepID=A0A8D8R4W3_9HEMI